MCHTFTFCFGSRVKRSKCALLQPDTKIGRTSRYDGDTRCDQYHFVWMEVSHRRLREAEEETFSTFISQIAVPALSWQASLFLPEPSLQIRFFFLQSQKPLSTFFSVSPLGLHDSSSTSFKDWKSPFESKGINFHHFLRSCAHYHFLDSVFLIRDVVVL